MATAKRTTVTLRNSRRRKASPIVLLAVPNLLTGAGIASANCGANISFPTQGLQFFHRDTIAITYYSDFASPTLSCWCGAPGRATRKLRVDHVSPFNGTALVLLNFLSDDPCWLDLSSDSGDCRVTSDAFLVSSNRQGLDDEPAALDGSSASTLTRQHFEPPSPTYPLIARTAAAVDSSEPASRGDSFSTGAKAALGVGIALICISIGAMAAFLYFRRRRRSPDAELNGGVDRRSGRRGPEKKRNGALSDTSGQSDEPLFPIQPVFDGFPGSMGYDDVRSLHSTIPSHSPTGGAQSPTNSQTGHPWTYERSIEREELTAARLKSQLQPSTQTIISYGPNPVTPTLTPRVTPRLAVTSAATPTTPHHAEQIPGHVPMMPLSAGVSDYPDYSGYSIPPPSDPKPSPPRQPAIPIVVSYGPNRVTPTPLVVSPTVPPDESIVNRRFQEAAAAATSHSAIAHERQFSWEADSPLLGTSMGPLPPYASTEDFEAMEKGAVRKLAEPLAQAELPPTKDGFYHYTSDVVEYELPGAAPQREAQLPFRPYQPQQQGGWSSGGRPGGGREIDEQKFLLDDGEILRMREEKARIRAANAAAARLREAERERKRERDGEGEEYDLGEIGGGRR